MSTTLPDIIPTKTVNEYAVRNFEVLDKPMKRYPCPDLIYKAEVFIPSTLDPNSTAHWTAVYYDFRGRCANFARHDCFVKLFDFPEP